MQDDMEQKRDMLLRRHQNFESFVTSLESGSKRPDIEYFEGESGIKQAYIKLLNGPGEILHYLPVMYKEEEDPLRDFRVQYFRERQNRKMFSRVLAHDTDLGRRYHSRDAFEYRKTVLVPEAEYPFTFEKIITGDRIACFDHKAKTACVIRYPELADIERTLFEGIWRHVQQKPNAVGTTPLQAEEREKIALSTEAMSQIREFFLSKKSLVAFGICALLSLGVTAFLYQQNLKLNKLRIQDRVKSIASTAALQFDANDINQIHTEADIQKPEYSKLIHQLNRIRRENEGVKYAYIMRITDIPDVWEFVSDADSLDPYAKIDINADGKIDDADHLTPPGEKYTLAENEIWNLDKAIAQDEITNQWGTFISGSAPIRNDKGEGVAILGIDVDASQLQKFILATFWPLASFLGFFILFVFVRLAAYNRAFFREFKRLPRMISLLHAITCKKVSYSIIACLIAIYWIAFGFIYFQRQVTHAEIGRRLMAIAATAASEFDPKDLEGLRFARDMNTPEYQRVFKKLNDIRDINPEIQWIYIHRPVDGENLWEFVADADSNIFLNASDDINSDGAITPNEENVWPGMKYFYPWNTFKKGLIKPAFSEQLETDQWGTYVTAVAPIKDQGKTVAILGIDFSVR
jgi:hypothetical protein